MPVESDHRESDSPYVARVWRGRASGTGSMTSVATSTWELVFWGDSGVAHAAVRGPETTASTAEITGDSESSGITFAHGTSMPHLPIAPLVDSGIESPHVTGSAFVLRGEEWEIPGADDAELFVQKLVRAGVLARDPLVDEVVWGGIAKVGSRSYNVASRLPAGSRRVRFAGSSVRGRPRCCSASEWRRSTSSIGSATTTSHTSRGRCNGSPAGPRRSCSAGM